MGSIARIDEIKNTLTGKEMQEQIKGMLPAHVTPERFVGVVMTALNLQPRLLEADSKSLYNSVLQAASDGLVPDGREGTIQLYGEKAKWMPMIGGICKLAKQSGQLANIDAVVVYEKDEFDSWVDEHGPHFKYRKSREADRGKVVLTFAYAITKDREMYFEEIDEKQMESIKKVALSKIKPESQKYSPWKGDFEDEMRRKSTIRRLAKYRLPSSKDLDQVIRREDEDFEQAVEVEQKPAPSGEKKSRLDNIIDTDAEVKETAPAAERKEKQDKMKKEAEEIKAGKPKDLIVEGKITEEPKFAMVDKDGQPTKKWRFLIGEKWYGTFDEEIFKKVCAVMDIQNKSDGKTPILVRFHYIERKKGDKVLNDITKFEQVTTKEVLF